MQDPLDQLRDIHLPESVGWWPLAWGWWLVFAVLLVAGAGALYFWRKHKRGQQYRHQAVAELEQAYARYRLDGDTSAYLQTLSELMRRATLSAVAGAQGQALAALYGQSWLAFLDTSLPDNDDAFSHGPGQALLSGPYELNPQADVDALQALARQWLLKHRIRFDELAETLPGHSERARHA